MAKRITQNSGKSSEGRKRRLANLKPFPKGQSGNPGGRPKTKLFSIAAREWLAAPNEENPELTNAEMAVIKCGKAALEGSLAALAELIDRAEGRPRQAIDANITTDDWREDARRYGLSEEDVIRETKNLIAAYDAERDAGGDPSQA
jgi:hypothetical protein